MDTNAMEKVTESLKEYRLTESSPIVLLRESSDNEVFVIGQTQRKILRVSKKLPIDDARFEYEAIEWLSGHGICVAKCVMTKTGGFYTLIDGRVAVMFDFLEGRHIKVDKDHLPAKAQAYYAGRVLGSMSNVASGFSSSSPRKRTIFSELERAMSFQVSFTDQFEGGREFINQVKEAIAFGKSQHEVVGLIHNDYRPSNVFFDDNDKLIGIIDFDWSCLGPIVKDLALAVLEWSFPDGRSEPDFEIFDSFLDGYNSVVAQKQAKDKRLYSWIMFGALSDVSTFFCDRLTSPDLKKDIGYSYMYLKYLYFSRL